MPAPYGPDHDQFCVCGTKGTPGVIRASDGSYRAEALYGRLMAVRSISVAAYRLPSHSQGAVLWRDVSRRDACAVSHPRSPASACLVRQSPSGLDVKFSSDQLVKVGRTIRPGSSAFAVFPFGVNRLHFDSPMSQARLGRFLQDLLKTCADLH
jgi:hypothetical protein